MIRCKPIFENIFRALEYVQHFANVATGELALPSCFMRGFKKPRQCPTVRQKLSVWAALCERSYEEGPTKWEVPSKVRQKKRT